jgi:DNA repair exonuclease SbcCD ATPase subunit
LEEQIQELTQNVEQLNQQKEDKAAALELLIDSWIELQTTMRHTIDSPSNQVLSRPKNEMELMNSMKKSEDFVEKCAAEVSSLKEEISGLVEENLDLKKRIKDQSEIDKVKRREEQLKHELEDERERASTLMEEVDNLKERLRCSEVIASELKRQVTQLSAGNSIPSSTSATTTPTHFINNNNPVALKQELKSVKEVIASREEMIQKLNEKYMRHRTVWEENERRANDEIKKLDEIIDRVVVTLSNCTPFINDCAPLKRLLEELTADQHNISNLSSTFV